MNDSLENKFKLATIAPLDRRMKRKHLAVYGFLLDWYHRKYGDALASVRHIVAQLKERDPAGLGLYTGDVHSALKDLAAWGYITATVGSGRQASRYVPVWAHGSSVHKIPNTTEDAPSVRGNQNTSVRGNQNTTADSVRGNENEDPSTLIRSQDPDTGKDGYDCAPATPPLPDGLMATGAGGAQESFDEVWRAYFPKRGRGDKKKARAAYDKLAPDADLQARIVASAADWYAAWAAQGDDNASRKHLDTWLAGEHYDCDPPGPYKAKERKKEGVLKIQRTHPSVERVVDIVSSRVDEAGGEIKLRLTFSERDVPKTWERVIVLQHGKQATQDEGQREFKELCEAIGVDAPGDSLELHRPVRVRGSDKSTTITYRPLAGNDNMEAAA